MNRKFKRGAIELSANFLVIIIISIVVLAGGLTLFFKLKDSTQKYVNDLDSQTQDKLKSMMLSNNYRVAVYPSDLELGTGDAKLVGIGITNNYPDLPSTTFDIVISVKYHSDPTAGGGSPANFLEAKFYDMSSYTVSIEPTVQVTKGILIKMPDSTPGQYVYTITVKKSGSTENYGTVQVYVYHK